MPAPKRILLDMDGVIADFDTAACVAHGKTLEEVHEIRLPGEWDLCRSLGCKSLSQFWEPIDKIGVEFWLSIRPLPWVDELIKLIESVTDDWRIVTSPSLALSCYVGKVKWLKERFGGHFREFHLTNYKADLANSETVLIDDYELNLRKFSTAGGITAMFPAYSNILHEFRDDPLPQLKEMLREIGYAL